jgi:hypothetical protein
MDLSKAGVQFCYKRNDEPLWLWGGAFDVSDDECKVPNPITKRCNCPQGYSVLDLSETGFSVCYK